MFEKRAFGILKKQEPFRYSDNPDVVNFPAFTVSLDIIDKDGNQAKMEDINKIIKAQIYHSIESNDAFLSFEMVKKGSKMKGKIEIQAADDYWSEMQDSEWWLNIIYEMLATYTKKYGFEFSLANKNEVIDKLKEFKLINS